MTTETNTVFDSVKEAFAPVTDALKNIQNLEVPEAAREFVKKTANTAKDRAADVYAGSEKVTAAIETAVADSVTEAAKISRNIQQAMYRTPRRSSPASTSWLPPSRSTKRSRSSRTCSVRAAKCSSRGPSRPPTISASSSPTARRPPRTTSPRSTTRPPDPTSIGRTEFEGPLSAGLFFSAACSSLRGAQATKQSMFSPPWSDSWIASLRSQ